VAVIGCKRESEKGGPGSTTTERAARDNRGAEESSQENTFSVKVPTGTKVQQGERKEISVTLNRGDLFKQDVKVSFKPAKGIKMVPDSGTIRAGESEQKFMVEAAADATPGDATIEVTGTPATSGRPASVNMTVTVQKKD
jgi:hypothetical protein